MCELFAMSSRLPTQVTLSFQRLAARGVEGKRNPDGWGAAFLHENDVQIVRDVSPASESRWARAVADISPRSATAIAHIREATRGEPQLCNTHPFTRELGGRAHVFAHNGTLEGVEDAFFLGRFRPLGGTDSEFAFCALMARMEALWDGGEPDAAARTQVLRDFAAEARALGPANFLYSDGDILAVHAHLRCSGAEPAKPPGLWRLRRTCPAEGQVEMDGVSLDSEEQAVELFASVPLSEESGWEPLAEGSLTILRRGEILESL